MDSKERDILRNSIDGELNRITVTDDMDEIIKMQGFLMQNIVAYGNLSRQRIIDKYKNEH